MRVIRTYGKSAKEAEQLLQQIENRSADGTARVEAAVKRIVAAVRSRGDDALRQHAERLDGLAPDSSFVVSPEEMHAAWEATPSELQKSMKLAAKNIRRFAQWQMPKSWTREAGGFQAGQRCFPLRSAGCYVPGGRYPLPSTLLMTTIPAQVAGVDRIVVVSPRPAKETLAAAHLAGIHEFYRIGGAQAIAALAYGTASIPRVDKIVGPGNLYVTTAKKLVAFDCGVDMLAGPTEVVVASENGNFEWIAADLVAQAEHDPEALAILVTSNQTLAKAVSQQLDSQSSSNRIAKQSLESNGVIFVTENPTETTVVTNRIAPEHLTIDEEGDLSWVEHAGSLFVGTQTPQSMGDYISGPNHVLPTGRQARTRGGLSVLDFLRIVTTQKYAAAGLAQLGPHAARLAQAEGLTAHAASVRIRAAKPTVRTQGKGD
ncbi:MAG TPA: histidinol dehydrogenase [Acidobacteriaceae bacterium]|nr:histidinol dehydrogenase [Acidobacteriaceae bacterium]